MWSVCLEKADQGEYQAAFDTVINSGIFLENSNN